MSTRHLLFSAIALTTNSFAASCFPGVQSLDSPSALFSVYAIAEKDDETYRLLIRENREVKSVRVVLDFSREACVLWAPNEAYFAVTWNMGSNLAETYIYSAAVPSRRVEVIDLLPAQLKDQLGALDHLYVVAKEWSAAGLTISINGQGGDARKRVTLDAKVTCRRSGESWRCDG